MFKLFKTKIPKDNTQEVDILESWTIEWKSFKHSFGNYADRRFNAKVFIKKEDALEFKKQLEESAKFINSTVLINLKSN